MRYLQIFLGLFVVVFLAGCAHLNPFQSGYLNAQEFQKLESAAAQPRNQRARDRLAVELERLQAAARQGDRRAQVQLGDMYYNGRRHRQNITPGLDRRQAAEWYQKAVDQGDRQRQERLGLMYLTGDGVAMDRERGCRLMRPYAERSQGHLNMQRNLNTQYFQHCTDEGAARQRDRQERDQERDRQAELVRQGQAERERQAELVRQADRDRIEHLRAAAERGDLEAQAGLSDLYFMGSDLFLSLGRSPFADRPNLGYRIERDYRTAFEWAQKAADRGHEGSQLRVAYMYIAGKGIIRDRAKGCQLMLPFAGRRDISEEVLNFYNRNCADLPQQQGQRSQQQPEQRPQQQEQRIEQDTGRHDQPMRGERVE